MNEYDNHFDDAGFSWNDPWVHKGGTGISITITPTRKGFGIPFKDEEDKKNFYLHRKYLNWLRGRPYKQPSFEEWKKLQTN
jgi:hypothetical protein